MAISKEERQRKRKIRRARAFTAAVIIVLFAAGVFFCLTAPLFDVTSFKVNGTSYYTESEILAMGNAQFNSNIFIGVNYKEIKERLLKDAYIKKVTFEKELPNTVVINVNERKQLGIIEYGSYYLVIDGEGMYLRKTDIMPELTTIRGFTLDSLNLGQKIGVEEDLHFEACLKVLRAMDEYNMFFYAIEPCEGDIKAYVLERLLCQGTAENITKVLENNSLQGAVYKLLNDGIERGTLKINDNSDADGIIFSPIIE